MSVFEARFALGNRIAAVVGRGGPTREIRAGEHPGRRASENHAGIGKFGGAGRAQGKRAGRLFPLEIPARFRGDFNNRHKRKPPFCSPPCPVRQLCLRRRRGVRGAAARGLGLECPERRREIEQQGRRRTIFEAGMREIQGGVSGKGSIEALISPLRPLAQYQRARPSFSELRQFPFPAQASGLCGGNARDWDFHSRN